MDVAVDRHFVSAVREGLAAAADPAKAPQMQRYMKSDLPFRGVQARQRQQLVRRLCTTHPFTDVPTLMATVRQLWHHADYREERYVALALCGHRRYATWQTPAWLPFYEELVVTGAWWDLVDDLATHRVGSLLRAYPREVRPALLAWAHHPDRWKRRTAVICQVGSKQQTDSGLLAEAVLANIGDRDFFLRKGIGWALREYGKTDAAWVRRFVAEHPEMSALSRREALKYAA